MRSRLHERRRPPGRGCTVSQPEARSRQQTRMAGQCQCPASATQIKCPVRARVVSAQPPAGCFSELGLKFARRLPGPADLWASDSDSDSESAPRPRSARPASGLRPTVASEFGLPVVCIKTREAGPGGLT